MSILLNLSDAKLWSFEVCSFAFDQNQQMFRRILRLLCKRVRICVCNTQLVRRFSSTSSSSLSSSSFPSHVVRAIDGHKYKCKTVSNSFKFSGCPQHWICTKSSISCHQPTKLYDTLKHIVHMDGVWEGDRATEHCQHRKRPIYGYIGYIILVYFETGIASY